MSLKMMMSGECIFCDIAFLDVACAFIGKRRLRGRVKSGVEPRVSVVNPVPVSNFNAVVVLALASGAM